MGNYELHSIEWKWLNEMNDSHRVNVDDIFCVDTGSLTISPVGMVTFSLIESLPCESYPVEIMIFLSQYHKMVKYQ